MWIYHRVKSPNDAAGMANSVDPDQTAPQRSSLIWSALFAKAYLSENLGSLWYPKMGKNWFCQKLLHQKDETSKRCRENPKNSDTKNISVILLKFKQFGFTMLQSSNNTYRMANSIWPWLDSLQEQSYLGQHCPKTLWYRLNGKLCRYVHIYQVVPAGKEGRNDNLEEAGLKEIKIFILGTPEQENKETHF